MSESTFNGFEPANTTAVPDILFDELLAILSGAELKILLYIIRRTIGFKKSTDAISFSQFENGITTHDGKVLDKGCGLNRETISRALKSLENRHCIKSEKRAGAVTYYSIYFKGDKIDDNSGTSRKTTTSRKNRTDQLENPTSQLVGKSGMTSRKKSISLVGKSDPQETVLQIHSNTNSQKEREGTSSSGKKSSFTPSELSLLRLLEREDVYIVKDERVVKQYLEKLAAAAKSEGELMRLIAYGKELYPNDLSLGNLVNKRVLTSYAQQQHATHTPESRGDEQDVPHTESSHGPMSAQTKRDIRWRADDWGYTGDDAVERVETIYDQTTLSDDRFFTEYVMAASEAQSFDEFVEWLYALLDRDGQIVEQAAVSC